MDDADGGGGRAQQEPHGGLVEGAVDDVHQHRREGDRREQVAVRRAYMPDRKTKEGCAGRRPRASRAAAIGRRLLHEVAQLHVALGRGATLASAASSASQSRPRVARKVVATACHFQAAIEAMRPRATAGPCRQFSEVEFALKPLRGDLQAHPQEEADARLDRHVVVQSRGAAQAPK